MLKSKVSSLYGEWCSLEWFLCYEEVFIIRSLQPDPKSTFNHNLQYGIF